MNNSKALLQDFINRVGPAEDPGELRTIGMLAFEHLYGLSPTDIMTGHPIADPQPERLDSIIERLRANEPIQYILGEAHFYDRTYLVNPSVLIPRPETEELVQQVIDFSSQALPKPRRILDIGTGSGCIPVTLALELAKATVFATDVSPPALQVAHKNADRHHAAVTFFEHNVLTRPLPVHDLDVIVSNPPYITQQEKAAMKPNVLAFEPHLALFVENNDPLLFYRAISLKAKAVLRAGGMLAFEINANFGRQTADLLIQNGYTNVTLVNDLQGKERIVKGFLA